MKRNFFYAVIELSQTTYYIKLFLLFVTNVLLNRLA